MPDLNTPRVGSGGAHIPSIAKTETPVVATPKPDTGAPASVKLPGDGVDAPRADAPAAEAPRKALNNKLGTMARRIIKGAAILGLAVGLAVGGSVFMKTQQHQPVQPPVPVEVPVQIDGPTLPTGPPGEAKPTEVAPTLPGAPVPGDSVTLPTIDQDALDGQRTFSPYTIRLGDALDR